MGHLSRARCSRGVFSRCNSHLGGRVTIEGRPIRLRPCFSDISVLRDKGREDCLGNCIYDRRDGLELAGRGEGRFSTDAHIRAIHGDYVVTPWCGKFMPALGGKLPIPGRKAMKPRFPTILPESLYYSGTILSLFGGGGRYWTDGAHSEYGVIPWSENACGAWSRTPRLHDQSVIGTAISDYSSTIPALSLHHAVKIGASCRTRTFSLSVLLQSATVPPQELASIRTEFLRQYNSWKNFQPFVQTTFTVCSKNPHCPQH